MANNILKYRDFLRLFDFISSKGVKSGSEYELSGIRAQHDFDGYTCWLAYKDLTITLLFHGKFDVEFDNKDTFDEFYKKANSLNALN
ncbi:DUF3081 family protein [Colwellia ponticola]|uniref:DUF3081 domain-containing protein n=1 Tax=Colwellia ponticola TaxID=2304625 RepID=A0A8H2JK62_9GAMM|nr:DUF3081 family protein [Colwellia ponticola]RGP39487.1 hypothetical protein BPTFM16_02870 [Altererythrobacter insulae]TMM43952.1 DUF3081 domain-containing protein [Colwellia ponticola]